MWGKKQFRVQDRRWNSKNGTPFLIKVAILGSIKLNYFLDFYPHWVLDRTDQYLEKFFVYVRYLSRVHKEARSFENGAGQRMSRFSSIFKICELATENRYGV